MKKHLLFTFIITLIVININAQIITTVAGNGTGGYTGDGGTATAAELYGPHGVAFDALGNLYIADRSNHRIRMVNTTGTISTVAGYTNATSGGDGGQATVAYLNYPSGVAIDAAGNVYIADQINSRIRMVNTAGIISTVAGYYLSGYSGDGGQATAAELYYPIGVAADAAGNLYIADAANNRIRKVTASTGIISTVCGTGTAGFSGDGGNATGAELYSPLGVALDAAGNLHIADASNNRIRKVSTAGIISTVAGNGTAGYAGDMGAATAAEINLPAGVAFDAAGNLFIGDTYNNRIRKINTAGTITTVAGNGTAAYAGDGGAATAAELYYPIGVAADAAGNLYIADNGNNRIRKVTNASGAGIEQFAASNAVTIYPNPNNGSFVIEPNSAAKQTMQVYDVNGKMVLSQNINGKTTIDASTLNEGVYNISLISNEGVVNKRLVIVR